MKIFGIRGEIISGQCALFSNRNLTNLKVEVSALKNLTSGIEFPANQITWNFVGSIPLVTNAPNQPQSILVRPAPAKYPDYLMEEKQINLNKGTYQAVWLTIHIPENTKAGTYSGKITVKSNQGEKSLPVFLSVFPLTLPDKSSLKVAEWYTTQHFQRFHGIDEPYSEAWFEMLRKYADNMVAHRQSYSAFRILC